MEKIKFNLKEVKIQNIDGSDFGLPEDHIAKAVGDILYLNSKSIDMEDFARTVHAGNAEADEAVIAEMIELINLRTTFVPMITRRITGYLNDKIQSHKNNK